MNIRAMRADAVRHVDPIRKHHNAVEINATTHRIIASFNTWAFKREQPTEPEMLAQVVANAVAEAQPVPFVLYWGKGPRAHVATPDTKCLDYLAAMSRRIANVYAEGARFNLCQTDTHAHLNGHSASTIESYFTDITAAATARGMFTFRLSTLVESVSPARPSEARAAPEVVDALERCAARWYRGSKDAREGALTYLAMNRVESLAVAECFPRTIFVTFNGRTYRDLFPTALPVFYMYSLRRGTSVKPWFMDAEGRAYEDAGEVAGD